MLLEHRAAAGARKLPSDFPSPPAETEAVSYDRGRE